VAAEYRQVTMLAQAKQAVRFAYIRNGVAALRGIF
jgi:hypothetical protein